MTEFGKHETTEEDLASNLPPWFPKDPSSGNYNLLKPIAQVIDDVDEDRERAEKALHPSTAETVDQIEAVADLVDIDPYEDESLEHYRVRVIAEFQLLTSKGTVRDLLNAVSTILDTSVNDVRYTEEHTPASGESQIGVPAKQLNQLELTDVEFIEIIEQLVPSSYRVDLYKKGTFTYISSSRWINTRQSNYNGTFTFITPTTYGNSDHDSSKGHDGLDTNKNPLGSGGTYSGVSLLGTTGSKKSYSGLDSDGNQKDSGGTYAGIIE